MSRDAGTQEMPAVRGLGARAYVGVPVVLPDGSFFGTLCGVDPSPQTPREEAVGLLSVLARLLAFQFDREQQLAEQRRARLELESLTAELQRRNAFEQELIGIVSHDLKNPIAAISTSAATLLRRGELPEPVRRAAERVLSSAERAGRMVHELLDFTLARHGGIPVQRQEVEVAPLVQQAVDEVRLLHPQRQVEVQLPPLRAVVDPDRLVQLLGNLVQNALTYSPADTPVRVRGHMEGPELVLTVHNQGEPLAPDILTSLFEPRTRGSHQELGRSLGLGLFIVRHLAEAHGGTVEVASSREAGTLFTVRLPPREGPAATPVPPASVPAGPLRVEALGEEDVSERLSVLTGRVLASELDEALQTLTQEAARRLGAPASTLNLILRRTQFVRAYSGLAPGMQLTRGSDRNASFCQFVVRHRAPFEVTDAATDPRVPHELVDRMGIRAYYGVPVSIGPHTAGSLCVVDVQPRTFSAEQREAMEDLARRASARLAELARLEGTGDPLSRVTIPVFCELRNLLTPLWLQVNRARMGTFELQPLLRLLEGHDAASVKLEDWLPFLEGARHAAQDVTQAVRGLQSVAERLQGSILGLEHIMAPRASVPLEQVVQAASTLSLHATRPVGGLRWPGEVPGLRVATPREAITATSAALVALCDRLCTAGRREHGLTAELRPQRASVHLALASDGLGARDLADVYQELRELLGSASPVQLHQEEDALVLELPTE